MNFSKSQIPTSVGLTACADSYHQRENYSLLLVFHVNSLSPVLKEEYGPAICSRTLISDLAPQNEITSKQNIGFKGVFRHYLKIHLNF